MSTDYTGKTSARRHLLIRVTLGLEFHLMCETGSGWRLASAYVTAVVLCTREWEVLFYDALRQ